MRSLSNRSAELAASLGVIFFGSSAFALPSLDALGEAGCAVRAVVTVPPRPRGRGRRTARSVVAEAAARRGLVVLEPESLRDAAFFETVRRLAPDVGVVVAYGKIVPPALLAVPRHGFLNVHGSLLPRWRGAAPVAWAILAGDIETGVTVMQMDAGLDTGPILAQHWEPTAPDDTAETLSARLARAGATVLVDTLAALCSGRVAPQPQDETRATYAPRLTVEDGRIDWTRSATEIERRVRALRPWPGAYTDWAGERVEIVRAAPADGAPEGAPGDVTEVTARGMRIACGEGALWVQEVLPAGKRPMPAEAFARGRRLAARVSRLGSGVLQ